MRVEKNAFAVTTTTSGKVLVESPLRLDDSGREPKEVLVWEESEGLCLRGTDLSTLKGL